MNKTLELITQGRDLESLVKDTGIPLNILVIVRIRVEKAIHSDNMQMGLEIVEAGVMAQFPKYFP